MVVRGLSTALTAPALEEAGAEALEASARVAELIALGPSMLELDAGARAGIVFLIGRIRAQFTLPALATSSSKELDELWAKVGASMLRVMGAVTVLIHEASPSELMSRRLEHGDTAAVAQLARRLSGASTMSDRLRRTAVLISDARARLRDVLSDAGNIELWAVDGFQQGVLQWAVGVGLCAEIAERTSALVDEPLRPDLIDDAIEFAATGARLAGYFAAIVSGLQLGEESFEELEPLLGNDDGVAFLVRATREIQRTFGPDAAFRLEFFRYPDAPDEHQYHVVIDSPASPADASERLDALCDGWWDDAAAELDVDLFPVVGVIDDG